MTGTIVHLRFGPACSDTAAAHDLIAIRRVPELAPLVPAGALVIDGHVLAGFEQVIATQRARLAPDHIVAAVGPCPDTRWFWDATSWSPVAATVADLRRTVDGCTQREPFLLLRAVLGGPPVRQGTARVGSHDGVRLAT